MYENLRKKYGVTGLQLTGPNGATIFLPAAGTRSRDELVLEDRDDPYGEYWLSSFDTSNSYAANSISFGKALWNYSNMDRFYGKSVRPVCP